MNIPTLLIDQFLHRLSPIITIYPAFKFIARRIVAFERYRLIKMYKTITNYDQTYQTCNDHNLVIKNCQVLQSKQHIDYLHEKNKGHTIYNKQSRPFKHTIPQK